MSRIGERHGGNEPREGGDRRIDRPAIVGLLRMLAHARRPHGGVDHDVEPEPEQQRETDRKHPETGQYPHQREHQERVGGNDQGKKRDSAPDETKIDVAEPRGQKRQQRCDPRGGAGCAGLAGGVVGNCHSFCLRKSPPHPGIGMEPQKVARRLDHWSRQNGQGSKAGQENFSKFACRARPSSGKCNYGLSIADSAYRRAVK